jgi:hypothetical protein
MDAGFVGERIGADNRLVQRHSQTGYRGNHTAGGKNFLALDVGLKIQPVTAGLDDHGHFFQRGIAGPLADAVHGAFHLSRTGVDSGQSVGQREAEIVVAVYRHHHLINIVHVVVQVFYEVAEFRGYSVAHGIRDIDYFGAGFYSGLDHLSQIGRFRTACIHGAEFHVAYVTDRLFDTGNGHLQNFFAALFKLVLKVNIRC